MHDSRPRVLASLRTACLIALIFLATSTIAPALTIAPRLGRDLPSADSVTIRLHDHVKRRYARHPHQAKFVSPIGPSRDQKRVCVYDHNSILGLSTFAAMVRRRVIDCAMVYTGSPDWAGWVDPWFLHDPDPNLNWAAWVRASPPGHRRQLIISQPLIPSGLANMSWRAVGAAGGYTRYARQLAETLVTDGVGDAIIRLSWEMNGTWNIDNIGTTALQRSEWIAFWRKTVIAMRSVPGARFSFVWCVNNIYRNVSFGYYYPGDDVVDIVGDDVYDAGVATGTNRWDAIYGTPGGLRDLIAFANRHRKPISIPEWGIGPRSASYLAGGDDSAYVYQLAKIIARYNVAFQSYFYAYEFATQLREGQLSLGAYRRSFGDGGTAVANAG